MKVHDFKISYLGELDDDKSHKKDVESDFNDNTRDPTPIAGIKVGQLTT